MGAEKDGKIDESSGCWRSICCCSSSHSLPPSMDTVGSTSTKTGEDNKPVVITAPPPPTSRPLPPSPKMELTTKEDGYVERNSFLELLQVKPVTNKLLSFLYLEDMKALSMASKGTLKGVRSSSSFSSHTKIHISKYILRNGLLKSESSFHWKHLSLEMVADADIPEGILKDVESLNLYLGPGLEADAVFPTLENILSKMNHLHMLGLEAGILNHRSSNGFYSNPKIQDVLGALTWIDIHSRRNEPSRSKYSIESGAITFHENMVRLSKVSFKRLTKFHFRKQVQYSFTPIARAIVALLQSNKDSLEEVELHSLVWDCPNLADIKCPNLKRLKLSADGRARSAQTGVISFFLISSNALEELDITLGGKFPSGIFFSFLAARTGHRLKKLCLTSKRFTIEGNIPLKNWHFLKGFPNLTQFSLRKDSAWPEEDFGIGESILQWLPTRTLRKLTLQGIQNFWDDELDSYDPSTNIGCLLRRFQGLEELDLLGTNAGMNIQGFQSLVEHCQTLTSLRISCPKLTDLGLTGASYGLPKLSDMVSLDQLTELVHLKISEGHLITAEGLLEVVKFRKLKTFDFQRDYVIDGKLSSDFILQLAGQNPSLESVTLAPFTYDEVPPTATKTDAIQIFSKLKQEVKAVNPLVRVLNLKRKKDELMFTDTFSDKVYDNDNGVGFVEGDDDGANENDSDDDESEDTDDSDSDYDSDEEEGGLHGRGFWAGMGVFIIPWDVDMDPFHWLEDFDSWATLTGRS